MVKTKRDNTDQSQNDEDGAELFLVHRIWLEDAFLLPRNFVNCRDATCEKSPAGTA